jgi:ABC-type uncharacterized transport system auxiliary subunit
MSMKSATMRWVLSSLVVLAMIAVLGGCAKKEAEQAQTTETTETTPETMASPMAGTYAAEMPTGTVTLTLNADNTAVLSMQPMGEVPASVENGTWAAGMGVNAVDVTFQKQMGDSTVSMTMNFAASGDSLNLSNAEAAGVGALTLIKQHEAGH